MIYYLIKKIKMFVKKFNKTFLLKFVKNAYTCTLRVIRTCNLKFKTKIILFLYIFLAIVLYKLNTAQ